MEDDKGERTVSINIAFAGVPVDLLGAFQYFSESSRLELSDGFNSNSGWLKILQVLSRSVFAAGVCNRCGGGGGVAVWGWMEAECTCLQGLCQLGGLSVRRKGRRRSRFSFDSLMLAGLVLGGGILGLSGYFSEDAQRQRQARADIVAMRLDAQAASYAQQKAAELADARYSGACIMPHEWIGVEPSWYPRALLIQEGEAVITGPQGAPVKDGAIVCDDRGNTAIVRHGIAAKAAYTGNAELINQRFADALSWHPKAQRSKLTED